MNKSPKTGKFLTFRTFFKQILSIFHILQKKIVQPTKLAIKIKLSVHLSHGQSSNVKT